MEKIIITNHNDLLEMVGKEIGPSEYVQITQEQINKFAEATGDYQWIHTDPERAKTESPFKKTIAHGYLTVSLIPVLIFKIIEVQNCKMQVNYSIDKMRFGAPVVVDSSVRIVLNFTEAKKLRDIIKLTLSLKIEIKDEKKPALTGEIVLLYS
ncbi:MAG: MaoC family dehydratase [Melioribacteraceae bacterium]|nr:MaoC family dehydratase [Melioribacteraceae bacterium]MCF8263894.1 MaoC family dehydratase [Melioribacteraceae bacterium]MCF8414370.1 MaoC family dehydratase [Melioribacteraceae bacterium]MCF8430299.1 MaoC family dehydratase [Melioribacteraceae bacterium]